jgi:succinate-acetate transporter protein
MVSSVARMTPAVRMELEPGGVLQMVEKVQRWDMGKPQEPEMNRVFGCFWMFFSVI